MKTEITDIKKFIDEKKGAYYVIYFDYDEFKGAFTYLTLKSLKYWRDRGVHKLKKGMWINVFKVRDTKYFRIVGMEGQN